MNIFMNMFMYCISVSLQITGAVIVVNLSLNSLKRKNVLQDFLGTNFVHFDSFTNKLNYDINVFNQYVLNRITLIVSILYISAGIILGVIFLNDGLYLICKIVIIFILIIVLFFITRIFVNFIISNSKLNKPFTKEELNECNLNQHAETITIEDIDNM